MFIKTLLMLDAKVDNDEAVFQNASVIETEGIQKIIRQPLLTNWTIYVLSAIKD